MSFAIIINFFFSFGQTISFSFLGGSFKKKSSEWIIHGSDIHVKCLLKALVFGTWKKNILIYSQMSFQLYQVHIITVIGLKSSKRSINWGFVGI